MNLSASNSGLVKVSAMKTVSATTLTMTSTALTRALSLVPIIKSQVTSSAITIAGKLMKPPGSPPSASGPAASHSGSSIPKNSFRIVPAK